METNKKIGNRCEKIVAKALSDRGYWVHIFAQQVSGQPCDIVAIKGYETHAKLIDVKHCTGRRFLLSRIEPNQINSFRYATSIGIPCFFAIVYQETIYWLSWEQAEYALNQGRTTIDILTGVERKWNL